MAKIIVTIPEPKEEYDASNQRQILEALNTLKNQLNFSFQTTFKNEQARLLIKQIQAVNIHSSAVTLTTKLTDTSASATHVIGNQDIAATSTTDIITNTLVLEEGDILKMTAETAAKLSGVISYAQLDRSQENG
jgi:NCAIR mutase (PurE)-related protein